MVDRVNPRFLVILNKSNATEDKIDIHTCSIGRMYLHCQYFINTPYEALGLLTDKNQFRVILG
ncbi:MAG: hypothetical protein RLZZ580_1934 [Cyanobacteriota bacterium]|jgi:hypothetical protein